jgi:3-oxoacyl-[acyl-carrier protein] reductase
MNLDLSQKYAVVCGSTQGLGYASAVELALLGCNVTLAARNEEKLKEAVAKLDTTRGQKHNYFVADFQHPDQVKAAMEKHLAQHPVVNILINNTGGPKAGKAIDADISEYLQAFNSHLICNQLLVQAVVPSMINSGYGRIINIISLSVKQPVPGLGVSNTIRGAVASWAKTLAGELGPHGITVNNVLPGYTKTSRLDSLMTTRSQETGKSIDDIEEGYTKNIPLRRIGKAEEFGAAVAFLCSPAAAYINGINLPVDGGMLSTL